jgi:hypothetical protein
VGCFLVAIFDSLLVEWAGLYSFLWVSYCSALRDCVEWSWAFHSTDCAEAVLMFMVFGVIFW